MKPGEDYHIQIKRYMYEYSDRYGKLVTMSCNNCGGNRDEEIV